MKDASPRTIHRADYVAPTFHVESIHLHFELHETKTQVRAVSTWKRTAEADSLCDLALDGQDMSLVRIRMNEKELDPSQYSLTEEKLTLIAPPDSFTLDITSQLSPLTNKSLEGLYVSSGNFCTQCEAEGFRKITWFLDRPDVMARYKTHIIADQDKYPVMLSNGNKLEEGSLPNGRHYVVWEDPHPKPSYLFALVAGQLVHREDTFTTMHGRDVTLQVYVEDGNLDKTEHCMASLKNAMVWDEKRFGREYDLDIFMIVAVGDFNMGAMENKGLNLFNSKYVLAKPDTATDQDYMLIEGIVGHEYFHNWSGNRVTCRDWFQLSLKEGFTVFRDQEFSADLGSPVVKRIGDISRLRAGQFPEDAGPTAHPVRPDSYVEISNFYTATVYDKGAEVVRMLHTLLGEDVFRQGSDLYFSRHDGQAVTCEDFVVAMEEASGIDLKQFRLWYSQAGTPRIIVKTEFDHTNESFTMRFKQVLPKTPGQPEKDPMLIPITMGLLDPSGKDLPLVIDGENHPDSGKTTRTVQLTQDEQSFTFLNITNQPIPSLFRNFSAPVHLEMERSMQDWIFQMSHDSDLFNRWEASQTLSTQIILNIVEKRQRGEEPSLPEEYVRAFGANLAKSVLDPAIFTRILSLPSEIVLAESMTTIDPENIHHARKWLTEQLAKAFAPVLLQTYHEQEQKGPYAISAEAIGRRALRNACLSFLMSQTSPEHGGLAEEQYATATNMTDRIAALVCLTRQDARVREPIFSDFFQRWKNDPLVIDKWFELQATSPAEETFEHVQSLTQHASFDIENPNKVRALLGTFTMANPYRFHTEGDSAYAFLTDRILQIDAFNPQVAARLITPLARWRRHAQHRRLAMKEQLQRIVDTQGASKDIFEIASKSLKD